jgi:hypothetical protein
MRWNNKRRIKIMSKPKQKKYYESHVEKDDDFEIKEYK